MEKGVMPDDFLVKVTIMPKVIDEHGNYRRKGIMEREVLCAPLTSGSFPALVGSLPCGADRHGETHQ